MALKQMESTMVKVGDNTFYIKPFPAFKAANLTGELASVLSPLLGAIAPIAGALDDSDNDDENNSILDMDVSKAAEALSGGMNISGDKLESLMKKLLLSGNVVIEYEDENGETQQEKLDKDLADEIFCGDIQDMFVLCVHVIKLNFNGFFKRFAALSGKVEQVAEKTARKIL